MKKIFFGAVLAGGILASCNSASNAKVAQQNRADYLKMKGDWQLTSVNYPQNFRIKPFDENADAKCFEGSVWHLIPNNYTGSYTLNGGAGCPSVTQDFRWEVKNGSQFQFKKVYPDMKDKNQTAGYALNLVGRTENTFALEQNVPFEGKMIKVTYNFQKIN
ncbi:lipocalin family protein [Cruoricaptor ignavus]|uniref:Lipocalin family protein n=1 Tax=Cruoricaptor ignavus TaxID=1118202 RepID=A0A7M1T4Q0_9FLAO|nr:lipocalin family protein [Cruoricaptor ignavus]QOR73862.1 lipocalin family protein [Cruoricaptor ignavus]